MKVTSAVLIATAAEASVAGAGLGLASVAGRWNGWLDVLAQLAPAWLLLSAVGGLACVFGLEASWSKRILVTLAGVGVISSAWLVAPELAKAVGGHGERPIAGARPLKVLTFNTWSQNLAPDGTVRAIVGSGADVVALQETDGLGLAQRKVLQAAYPYWQTCRPACDLLLFSKRPWSDAGFRQASAPGGTLNIVWGQTTAPDGRVFTLATTHLAWPFPPARQASERLALAAAAQTFDRSNLVLTGDFNLSPWSAALNRLDQGLAPLTRRTHAIFSWPANIAFFDRPAPFPLIPIDQVYAGPAWRTAAVRRLPRLGSDHYGVLVTLQR